MNSTRQVQILEKAVDISLHSLQFDHPSYFFNLSLPKSLKKTFN